MREVPEEPRREQELAVLAADASEVDDESVGVSAELGAGQGRSVDLCELGRARRVVDRHALAPDAGAAHGAGAVLDGAELQRVRARAVEDRGSAHASDSGRGVVAHPPNQLLAVVHGKLGRVVAGGGGAGEGGLTWDWSIMDKVSVPSDLEPGAYLLSWRWDCEESTQVWQNCADIEIVDTDP